MMMITRTHILREGLLTELSFSLFLLSSLPVFLPQNQFEPLRRLTAALMVLWQTIATSRRIDCNGMAYTSILVGFAAESLHVVRRKMGYGQESYLASWRA
jgi:hypothetical protein